MITPWVRQWCLPRRGRARSGRIDGRRAVEVLDEVLSAGREEDV